MSRHTAEIVISAVDPASKQPLPQFSGLRMRDAHATHLGASLLAPPLPFEINLGPPRAGGEQERRRVAAVGGVPAGRPSGRVPAVGRPLDWHMWAGGAKRGVLGMFAADRRMLRVGCPGYHLLYAKTELQTMQERY